MSTPNEPTFSPTGQDTHQEPDLLLQPIPKATRFRRKLVYALLGTAIAAVSVIFTYGLMKSNHHDKLIYWSPRPPAKCSTRATTSVPVFSLPP